MNESPFWIGLKGLQDSIAARDDDAIEDALMLLETDFDTIGLPWPAGFFAELTKLLNDPNFLSLAKSWKLLYFIRNNWEQITDADRSSLKELLIEKFDKYADWMGAFVSSEILGERYPNASTLTAFTQLAKTAQSRARALVPHGIEYLAKSATDEPLRRNAVRLLRELKENDSEEVREEALISLRRLGYEEN